ncbi:endonuclease MutS2 [Geoglobus sp.]
MELTLSGDARAIYSKIVETLVRRSGIGEVEEELRSLTPVKDPETIRLRQEEVREKVELARSVSWEDITSIREFVIRRRFFEDRIFVARSDEEYERASSLRVCEVTRERGWADGYTINLSEFVERCTLEELAPELIVETLLSNIDTLKTLSRLEQEHFGNETLGEVLSDLEGIRSDYERAAAFDDVERLAFEIEERINREIEERLAEIKLTLTADELLRMVGEGRVAGEIEKEVERIVAKHEAELHRIGIYDSVFHRSYPVKVDTEALFNAIRKSREVHALDYYLKCRKIAEKVDIEWLNDRVSFYRRLALYKYLQEKEFAFPEFGEGMAFLNGRNLFISNPQPVSYCVGSNGLFEYSEGVVILTGANSGGKTSLLDLICQIAVLFHMGLPVNADMAECTVYDEIFYFKRKRSGYGSGAFERAMRSLVKAISGKGRKLILVDEFEAITEPGAAARILTAILRVAHEKGHHVVLVSHLGEEFMGMDFIRIDGIEAKGLDESFNLIVDRQPVFGKIGRSTPELIVERLMEKSRGEGREILARVLDELRSLRG